MGKTHKGLKIHMKLAHKMHVTSIEPPQRRPSSKRLHVDAEDEDDALVPVKKLTPARNNSRAIVSVPSSRVIAPANITNVTELIDAFKALSEAHERLARSHEELARSHEVAIAGNGHHFSSMESMRGTSSRELVTDPSVTIKRIRPPGYSSPPIVTFGRLVWLANITASDIVDPTTAGQMRQALVNLVHLLVEAGTDALHLTSVTIYLNDIRDMYEMFTVMDKFFTECGISEDFRPMRTALQSQASKDRTLRVELCAEAVLPGKEETALHGGVPTPRALVNA